MRFETDGDTVGVETDPEDTELARAVADTARSAVDLVTALSGDGDDDAPSGGECYECGEAGDLRPFAAANEAGEPISIDVCGDCQGDLVAAQIEANADAEPVGGGEDVPDDIDYDRLPDGVATKEDVRRLLRENSLSVQGLPREGDA